MSGSIQGIGGGGANHIQKQTQTNTNAQQQAAQQALAGQQQNNQVSQTGAQDQSVQGVNGAGATGAASQTGDNSSVSSEAKEQQALSLLQQGGDANIQQALTLLQGDTSNAQLTSDLQALQQGSTDQSSVNKVIQDLGGQTSGTGQTGGNLPGQMNMSALQQNYAAA